MKQLMLVIAFLSLTFTSHAQGNKLKLSTPSFQKTYSQTPFVIETKNERKSPSFTLPKTPNIIWKQHTETVSYYNNHPANPLCFNQSKGWKMIQVRPMKHQIVAEAATLTAGFAIAGILEILGQL